MNKVYLEPQNLGINTNFKKDQEEIINGNQKGIRKLMRILSDIFVPIIAIIAATGSFPRT